MKYKNVFKSRLQEIVEQASVLKSNRSNQEAKQYAIDDIHLVSLKLLELLELETMGNSDVLKNLKRLLTLVESINKTMSIDELLDTVDDVDNRLNWLIHELKE